MADLGGTFNSEAIKVDDFKPIPAGWYNAIITDSEWKVTASGNGRYLQFRFQFMDEGEYKGRVLTARLNLDNQNETARKIAQEQLARICKAVNVLAPSDSAELHNIPLAIHVVLQKNMSTDDFVNDIHGFKPRLTASAQQAPASSDAGGTPPWLRK